MDSDSSGRLTLPEMVKSFDTEPAFREVLEVIDIRKEDLPLLFEFFDVDRSGDICYKEFVEQLHVMRSFDMHTLIVFIMHNVAMIRERTDLRAGVEPHGGVKPATSARPLTTPRITPSSTWKLKADVSVTHSPQPSLEGTGICAEPRSDGVGSLHVPQVSARQEQFPSSPLYDRVCDDLGLSYHILVPLGEAESLAAVPSGTGTEGATKLQTRDTRPALAPRNSPPAPRVCSVSHVRDREIHV